MNGDESDENVLPVTKTKHRVVLSQQQSIEIFQLKYSHGYSSQHTASTKLSRDYNVSPKAIRDIWNGRSWLSATSHLWNKEELPPRKRPGRPLGRKDSRPRKRKFESDADVPPLCVLATKSPMERTEEHKTEHHISERRESGSSFDFNYVLPNQSFRFMSTIMNLPAFSPAFPTSRLSSSNPILAPLAGAFDTMESISVFSNLNPQRLPFAGSGYQPIQQRLPNAEIQLPSITSYLDPQNHSRLPSMLQLEAAAQLLRLPPLQPRSESQALHYARDAGHAARDAGHAARDAGHDARDGRHDARNGGHAARDGGHAARCGGHAEAGSDWDAA